MLNLTRFIGAFEITNWLWEDVWVVCFLKAQLHSSYIWGLNYKPFGTGQFHDQKKDILDGFLQTESMDGAFWQEFRELIACDHQEDFVDDEVQRMPELESFKNKGVLIKPARWFSWNQCCSEYSVEFPSLKMLLKHKFKGDILPNDVVEETQLIGMGKRVGVESKKASEQDEDILRGLARMRKASDPRKELQDLKQTMGHGWI